MLPLPYYEDIISIYMRYVTNTLFPDIKENKWFVYFLSVFHIVGVQVIILGILMPPQFLPYILAYLAILIFTYYIFDGHCFITLFSNKYSKIKNTPLHIRMKTAIILLCFYIAVISFSILYPQYSPYKIIQRIFTLY
jgi:hypothetical protein